MMLAGNRIPPVMHRSMSEFYRPLLRYFTRRTGHPDVAQDLTHDVFIRLSRYDDRFDDQMPNALVFTVAANVLKDWHQRQRRNNLLRTQQPGTHGGIDWMASSEADPGARAEGRQQLEELNKALNELSERTRDILILFRLEKMRQRDIAAAFNISVSAVEKHIAKATAHLAKRLGDFNE